MALALVLFQCWDSIHLLLAFWDSTILANQQAVAEQTSCCKAEVQGIYSVNVLGLFCSYPCFLDLVGTHQSTYMSPVFQGLVLLDLSTP